MTYEDIPDWLTSSERDRVRRLIARIGLRKAAKALDVHSITARRIAADRPVCRGTALVIREQLAIITDDQ